ncbi:MAG: hypothetical protein QY325_04370 [Flavobacteriales bacterium]|nr:MAG: hypothetical protein QY325_04370 [Flavobacteriales bacterium]
MSAFAIILGKLLRNPWFWVAVAVIILLLLARKHAARWSAALKRAFARDAGDYSVGLTDGAGRPVQPMSAEAQARQQEIKDMAQEAYAQMNAGITDPGARQAALEQLLSLNDTELRLAAREYNALSRNESLYAAIANEWMPFTEVDEQLMARLARIAMT